MSGENCDEPQVLSGMGLFESNMVLKKRDDTTYFATQNDPKLFDRTFNIKYQ